MPNVCSPIRIALQCMHTGGMSIPASLERVRVCVPACVRHRMCTGKTLLYYAQDPEVKKEMGGRGRGTGGGLRRRHLPLSCRAPASTSEAEAVAELVSTTRGARDRVPGRL